MAQILWLLSHAMEFYICYGYGALIKALSFTSLLSVGGNKNQTGTTSQMRTTTTVIIIYWLQTLQLQKNDMIYKLEVMTHPYN